MYKAGFVVGICTSVIENKEETKQYVTVFFRRTKKGTICNLETLQVQSTV